MLAILSIYAYFCKLSLDRDDMSFGMRLRQERKRLGLSQVQFAELGGVKRVSQHLYEQDVRLPDLTYIFRLAGNGVDIAFLVLGKPIQTVSSTIPLEAAVAAFRAVDDLPSNRFAALTPFERERMFESLCRSLGTGESAAPNEPNVPQTRQVRGK